MVPVQSHIPVNIHSLEDLEICQEITKTSRVGLCQEQRLHKHASFLSLFQLFVTIIFREASLRSN